LAGLGRKEFNSGDILLASEVQGYLQDQAVMVFDDATARGSAIPSPSEGMLTYNKATDQLELYDGSAFGPVGSDAGLIHIKQESGSAVSAISVNDCFSAEFESYEIIFNGLGNQSSANIQLRLRVGGTDLTANDYNFQQLNANSTSVAAGRISNTSSAQLGVINTTQGTCKTLLANPFKTTVTNYQANSSSLPSGTITTPTILLHSGNINNTNSYTGFTLFPSSGTMTGVIDVYGYKLGS
jgi:hypothetical protein